MKKLYLLMLLFINALNSKSQTTIFQKAIGGNVHDLTKCVQQTADGGYVAVGITTSFGGGNEDVYVVKIDALGAKQWARAYGGSADDGGYSIQQTTDGGYIIAGVTASFGAGAEDVYLIKTDANGIVVWSKTIGGNYFDVGRSVQQTADGGYIVAGLTNTYGTGSFNFYLIKTDATGTISWTKTFGGSADDHAHFVKQTTDGGYILCGLTTSFNSVSGSVYVVKTDASGNETWSKKYGSNIAANEKNTIQQTTDGGYIISTSTWYNGDPDACIIKTDATGNILWANSYDINSDKQKAHSVKQTSDGGYIACGYTDMGTIGGVYLVKTNATGVLQWSKIYQGGGWGYDVHQTSDGGYIAVGDGVTSGLSYQFCFIKTDASGNTTCYDTVLSTVTNSPPITSGPVTTQVSSGGNANAPNTLVTIGGTESSLCSGVGINENDKINSSITIYPNPNNGEFKILNKETDNILSIETYNVIGEKMYVQKNNLIQPEIEINISNYSKGIYFIKINGKEKNYLKKIIIE